jgi:hypothetical protein
LFQWTPFFTYRVFLCAADPHAGNILFCLSTTSALKPGDVHDAGLDQSADMSTSVSDSASEESGTPLRFDAQMSHDDSPASQNESTSVKTPGISEPSTSTASFTESEDGDSAPAATRHIYDATPGKTVTFLRGPSADSGDAANAGPGVAPQQPAAHPVNRRMIYDATPAKGVGFASNVTLHSARSYNTATPERAPSAKRTPAKRAGSTPFMRLRPSSELLISPASSAHSLRSMGSFLMPEREQEVPLIIPGLLDFGMTVR